MVAMRNLMLHTIGNLTLLSIKLNPSISNGSWNNKVIEIKKHSKLNLNLDLWNQWPNEWDETRIRERGKSLFKLAVRIWPRS